MRNNEQDLFEADPAAEAGWTEIVAQAGEMTLFPEADSWYMSANIPDNKRQLINFPSLSIYAALCDDVAEKGYHGLAVENISTKETTTE